MTGFSPTWLALREPADHQARNREVLAAVARRFADRPEIRILDLGSGSGSNLRGLAAHLPIRQRWRLVDYDPRLIEVARTTLSSWADEATPEGDGLSLVRQGKTIDVVFLQADLSANLNEILNQAADLVTAAAFFDLVSADWIERFADCLAAQRLPLYTVLIYNGEESWLPAHPADNAVNAAFNAHQRSDKGFGPACGPDATRTLAQALQERGYEVILGESPWRLNQVDVSLIAPLADGIAEAVGQTGAVPKDELRAWRKAHRNPDGCVIGHTDLLAIPPG